MTLCTSSDLESDVSGSRVYSYEPELNTSIRFYHKSLKYPGYGRVGSQITQLKLYPRGADGEHHDHNFWEG